MSLIEKMYKSELFSRHDDDGSVFYFSAEDFAGLRKEPYDFVTKSGHKLRGYFYSYENPIEGRIVVFDHGMGVGHRAYLKEIEMLARHGYLVYSYDHTGCTESEGEGIRGFLGSLADLDSCLDALKRDFAGKSLSVVGHSWGGFSTLNISAYHPDITHAVALSGFSDVHTIQREAVPFFLLPFRARLVAIEREANPDYINSSAKNALEATDAKVLIIHSADDKTVSAKNNFERLKKALSHKKNIRFLSVTGKNHNPTYTEEAVKYKEAFFKALKRMYKKKALSTDEDKKAFIASYDFEKMTEQDESLWAEIFKTLDN